MAVQTRSATKLRPLACPRLARVVVAILSICLVDVGLCRAHYHVHLLSLGAERDRALAEVRAGVCPADVVAVESRDCEAVTCQFWARRLAEQRQGVIEFVRGFHPVGKILAEGFDSSRNQDQFSKLNELLAKKQCDHVINSSARSNAAVDLGCFLAGILGVAGLVGSINI